MDFGSLPKVLKQRSISTILVFVNQLVGSLLGSSCFTGTSIRPNLFKHPINIGHVTDISQFFWPLYQRLSLRFFKSQQYRTPRQTLATFSTIDPQFFGQFPIPPGLDLIGKRQSGYRLEPVSLKSNDTLPEILFIMTALQHFNCFLPLPHSSKSLCHNADLLPLTVFSEIHAFLIR